MSSSDQTVALRDASVVLVLLCTLVLVGGVYRPNSWSASRKRVGRSSINEGVQTKLNTPGLRTSPAVLCAVGAFCGPRSDYQWLNITFTLLSLFGICEEGYHALQAATSGTDSYMVGDTLHGEGAPQCSEPSVSEEEVV